MLWLIYIQFCEHRYLEIIISIYGNILSLQNRLRDQVFAFILWQKLNNSVFKYSTIVLYNNKYVRLLFSITFYFFINKNILKVPTFHYKTK